MKPIKLCLVLAAACISFEYAGAQASDKSRRSIGVKTEFIKVEGQCGTCRKHIEKTALNVDGIKSAFWNEDNKILTVKFDVFKKSAIDSLHRKIAAAGFNTGRYSAGEEAYHRQTCCCQPGNKTS